MAGIRLFSLDTWLSVGVRRRPTGVYFWVFAPFAVAVSAWVISAATWIIISQWTLAMLFFSGMAALTFLTVGATKGSRLDRPPLYDQILAALAIATGVYFALHADSIEVRIFPLDRLSTPDFIFGSLVFGLTVEIARRTTGLGLTSLVAIFVTYNLFGHHLGGIIKHGYISYEHFLNSVVFTTEGIFGQPVRVAATYAFLFVLFGTLLQACKGSDFFFDFAAAISGRRPGGPAKVAVISSGMYGMVSGSPTSDVVTTGSITIPIMKRLGYRGALAGAIEVAASTGGSLVPPVMGTAAFIMVDYTGIDYRDIAIAALLPAILYYVSIYAQVHFNARRRGLKPLDPDRIPKLLTTLREGGLFFIPLIALTVALLQGYTPTYVAIVGSLVVLAVAMVRAKTRIGLRALANVLIETCYRMVPVAGATAAAGLIIAGITMTGLAGKFSHLVYGITDAQVFATLIIAAGLTIVLGLGMPTPSAYILAAALMEPVLAKLGLGTLQTHMFILYYAVMSALTPPVAVAAYAASSIAEDNPLYIAILAVKFALAAFLVPFMFVYGPELLMIGTPLDIALALGSAAVGLVLIAAAIEGFLFRPLPLWGRPLLAAVGLWLVFPGIYASISAVVVVGAMAAISWKLGREGKTETAAG